ncbi:MAG: hypothetical protein COC15_00730 [Legionellales bacterium]|nr:MAG: hypothetical protein COC15_00730 [Legionellales bacterium]
MRQKSLPCCFFPTTVMLVDDDSIFLKLMENKLGNSFPMSSFSNPAAAAESLSKFPSENKMITRCLSNPGNADPEHELIDINIREIHYELYNKQRFATVSVLLIDYDMPGMNGIEVSKHVQDPRIKKVLLTGQADNDVAVQAFNDGLIHKFVQKSVPDLATKLRDIIQELQFEYFMDLSRSIMQGLRENSDTLQSLRAPEFIKLHKELMQQNDIVEYYLIDARGSFVMVNGSGQAFWLVLKSDSDMNRCYEYAKFDAAPKEILESLQQKTKIPFFYTEQDLVAPPETWGRLLHPATLLPGDINYYYSMIASGPIYRLEQDLLLPYQAYAEL